MNTNSTGCTVVVVLPYCAVAEAHLAGCKASTRRLNRVATEVLYTTTVEEIRSMKANSDEGAVKIHNCLAPHIA